MFYKHLTAEQVYFEQHKSSFVSDFSYDVPLDDLEDLPEKTSTPKIISNKLFLDWHQRDPIRFVLMVIIGW